MLLRGGSMRAIGFWAALTLAGCSGKSGSDTGGGDDDDATTGDIVIDCSAIPQFTLDGMNCEQLASALEPVTSGSLDCNVDADCQPIPPGCQDWPEARCYYAANTCVKSTLINDFNSHSQDAGCGLI